MSVLAATPVAAQAAGGPTGLEAMADRAMGVFVTILNTVFFVDVAFWDNAGDNLIVLPLVVLWLVAGSIFLTFRMGFINVRAFRHAIDVVRGRFSDPSDAGEVSHFQALSAALSATVGLGNIAGVAIAVSIGGPGATFWMIMAGLIGMSAKFTECTLGQKYREVRPDGRVMGGAMFYLSKGLKEQGKPRLGRFLAVMFAILCIGGSMGGGNTFQVNQSMGALQESIPVLVAFPWLYGLVMAALVGVVIIGGISRIADVASKIVPTMVGVYVLAALWILFGNAGAIPAAFGTIFGSAFSMEAGMGGFVGVLVVGFQRAAFSNEAGTGSAAIAHSAARTPHAVREGIVALLEPFIDTVVVCTMTALVIVITGAYENPAYADLIAGNQGAALTARAFGEQLSWFPMVLGACVVLFAFSTMISWSYYGERCWAYLFGDGKTRSFQVLFITFTFLGSVISSTNVLDFGDLMILGMAFPNLMGVIMLSGSVRTDLDTYWSSFKAGEFKKHT
jgi:AGCS family alanine or glycine:cation symporter